ncbi:MAG: flagellar basal body rod protein FlgC, partial [Acidocella sp. 20-61-6]
VGSALDSQNQRMGVIASNLANVNAITPPGGTPYRAQEVVFAASPVSVDDPSSGAFQTNIGVNVVGTVQSNAPPKLQYDPGSPYADTRGYVTGSNVSQIGQMVDLIDSSNSYAASVAVLQQTSRIDQQMLSSFQVS